MNTTFELNRVQTPEKMKFWDVREAIKDNSIAKFQHIHYSLKGYYSLFIILLCYSLKFYIYSLFFRTPLFTNHYFFYSLFTLIKNFRPLFINHYTPSRPSVIILIGLYPLLLDARGSRRLSLGIQPQVQAGIGLGSGETIHRKLGASRYDRLGLIHDTFSLIFGSVRFISILCRLCQKWRK